MKVIFKFPAIYKVLPLHLFKLTDKDRTLSAGRVVTAKKQEWIMSLFCISGIRIHVCRNMETRASSTGPFYNSR